MRSLLRSLPVGAGTWLLLTAACTAVRTLDPADLRPPHPPTRVSVTRADNSTVVFDSARVSAHSLIGIVNGQPQRLPLSKAIVLRAREPSPERTAALVFFGASGVAVALVLHVFDKASLRGPCNAVCNSGPNLVAVDCCPG